MRIVGFVAASARFIVTNLQSDVPDPVKMMHDGNFTTLSASYSIIFPDPGDYILLVQLFSGKNHLSTLNFDINVIQPDLAGGNP